MASCSTHLKQIFQTPLPGNQTFIDSLSSWNQINSIKPPEISSYTEIFGELHFKENHTDDLNPNIEKSKEIVNNKLPSLEFLLGTQKSQYTSSLKKSDSFLNLESLHLCTEGLGFESSADVEESKSEDTDERKEHEKEKEVTVSTKNSSWDNMNEFRRPKTTYKGIPPLISCMGRSGQPRAGFQAYRHDGRFILQEISIPTREFLHASREGGHLRLHLVQPDEEIIEEDEDEDEEQKDAETDPDDKKE
ncbi:hypothetical protein GIB67_011835 [Kingdonia uniflora]|uniref:FAF domain-containing protein n=1 Tax=Kingdonia uniflora TaxID=39325 RepID=A0A7J7NYE3_9MAGN|nr:hypothetical protein GIB67_011835 [Kingdonia uniflora]